MRRGRIDAMLLRVLGDRDEITMDELRAALFVEYSEAELLRQGVACRGNKSRAAIAYEAGNDINSQERRGLLSDGIKFLIRTRVYRKNWLQVDKVNGVLRRVRKELG